jgi:hypothetical protein
MPNRDKTKAAIQWKRWYEKNKEKRKQYDSEWQLVYRYGITRMEFKQMLENQKGVCAICKQPETAIDKRSGLIRQLAVDHCHNTGKVRGLLCTHCNHGLGKFKDDVNLLQTAINYLSNYSSNKLREKEHD